MKITVELIRRFLRGECTEVEKSAVQLWLEEAREEPSSLPDEEMEGIVEEMWQDIASGFPGRKPRLIPLRRVFPYAAAACLLLGGTAAGLFMVSGGPAARASGSDKGSEGLLVDVMSDSRVQVAAGACDKPGAIRLHGNALIRNNGTGDFRVDVVSEDVPGRTKTMDLEKGRKYLAFHHRYKAEELYVIDASAVHRLPPFLLQKVKKTFEI
jgi:hypothetical protein